MNSPERVRVVLELEHDDRTISGRIAIDDAPGWEFYGWLELIERLERARDGVLPKEGGTGYGK